jgi:hypothetical protein
MKAEWLFDDNTPMPSNAEDIGTSTSDAEAPLREIGRVCFGIKYPRDITPRPKRLPPATPRQV